MGGLGVPDLLCTRSPVTISGSKSAGSGPFVDGAPSCRPRAACLEAFLEGERFLDVDLPVFEPDLEGEA